MKKTWIIAMICVICVVSVILSFTVYFIYTDFFGCVPEEPPKQPFFVNCTYYIYPNGTYAVVNITLVIQLGKVKPLLRDPKDPNFEYFTWRPYYGKFIDKDHDNMLSEGDQYYLPVSNNTTFYVELFYYGPDADGKGMWAGGILWDSKHGPHVWKLSL